jgi:hypothetical protein
VPHAGGFDDLPPSRRQQITKTIITRIEKQWKTQRDWSLDGNPNARVNMEFYRDALNKLNAYEAEACSDADYLLSTLG